MNVLVYAFWVEAPDHDAYRAWLGELLDSDAGFGVSELVLSGFARVVTNPRVFSPPAEADKALKFADVLRSHPNAVIVVAGPRHWEIFSRLCRQVEAKGNIVADAYYAALAIESGSEWITADRDFSRFPGLDWRHPLDG